MARTGDVMPPDLRAALRAVFDHDVDDVEIFEHSWFARLHGHATATTRRNRIYLRGSAADFFADPSLMLHEYFHVLRQWNCGRMSLWSYLAEWRRNGYWRNRYERQARRFVALRLPAFHRELSSTIREPA
jgi:hypothetical protein